MSKLYKKRPSELINIDDDYIAYCFDEAVTYIISQLEEDKVPHFEEDRRKNSGLQLLMAEG